MRIHLPLLVTLALSATLCAQTPQEISRKFTDLRSDKKPNNGCEATAWLYKHREALKDQMLAELYNTKTDRQARDAILIVLFRTESFVPDQRFARLLIARLKEHDQYVGNIDLTDPVPATEMSGVSGAHHLAWEFIETRLDVFEPLLIEQIKTGSDAWIVWSAAWVWKKRGLLPGKAAAFTPDVLTKVVANLRNDEKELNASWAARFFLLIGDQGLPALRGVAKSADSQQASLARALIDAITKGEHRAYGYLTSKVDLARTPYGPWAPEPEWLGDLTLQYMDRENYP